MKVTKKVKSMQMFRKPVESVVQVIFMCKINVSDTNRDFLKKL